jgi:hypothetical protein
MHFSTDGTFYNVARITGPTHNLLGIRFAGRRRREGDPSIEALRDVPAPKLAADEVLREVLTGVAEANARNGTVYAVEVVRFVPDDTPPVSIYRVLAAEIVGRLAQGGAFVQEVRA